MNQPAGRRNDRARSLDSSHNCGDCEHVIEGPASTGSEDVLLDGLGLLRMCDRGTHTNCPKGSWRVVAGAATVLANSRPVARRGDDTQHCAGMGTMIDGSEACLVGGPTAFAHTTPIEDPVRWILARMLAAAAGPLTREIRELREVSLVDDLVPPKQLVDIAEAFRLFAIYNWPDTRKGMAEYFARGEEEENIGIWDYKSDIITEHGEWAYDPTSDCAYAYDVWSNILFGYNGRAAGFSASELKSGAGGGQVVAGTSTRKYWKSWFDDPRDTAAIEIGIELWDRLGTSVTENDLLNALRAKSELDPPRGIRRNC